MLNQVISSGSPPTRATPLIFSAIPRGLKGSREAFGLPFKNVRKLDPVGLEHLILSPQKAFLSVDSLLLTLHFFDPCDFLAFSGSKNHVWLSWTIPVSSRTRTAYRSCSSCRTSTRWWRWWAAWATVPSHDLKTHRHTSVPRPPRCGNTFPTCCLSASQGVPAASLNLCLIKD